MSFPSYAFYFYKRFDETLPRFFFRSDDRKLAQRLLFSFVIGNQCNRETARANFEASLALGREPCKRQCDTR